MKRCSTLLIIREMEIKTMMRSHLIPIRMAVTKNTRDSKSWWPYGEKGPLYALFGMLRWCSLYGKEMGVPQKKNVTTIGSSNPIFKYIPKGNEISTSKWYFCSCVAALVVIAKYRIGLNVDEWMGKENMVFVFTMEYCSAIEKRKSFHMSQHGWTWRTLH